MQNEGWLIAVLVLCVELGLALIEQYRFRLPLAGPPPTVVHKET